MIKISVKNKRDAVKASYHLPGKTAIISINNVADAMYPARFNHCEELVDVLSLFFDDVLREEPGAMTKEDAVKIRDFLKRVIPKIKYLIVHCSAGVSRSAGVAAAIMKALTGSDLEIYDSPRYRPNNHCYRTTLNELLDTDGNSIFKDLIEISTKKNPGKYTKKELALKLFEIEDNSDSIEIRNVRFKELLDAVGDIPLWKAYTLKAFIEKLKALDQATLKDFNRPLDGGQFVYAKFDTKRSWEIPVNSFEEALNLYKQDLENGAEIILPSIYRNQAPSLDENAYQDLIIIEYNKEIQISKIWGGTQEWEREELRQIYKDFGVKK